MRSAGCNKVFIFKRTDTAAEDFYSMKKTLSGSARTYSIIQSGVLNFHEGSRRVKTGSIVDDRQLLSAKKLLKKSTITN